MSTNVYGSGSALMVSLNTDQTISGKKTFVSNGTSEMIVLSAATGQTPNIFETRFNDVPRFYINPGGYPYATEGAYFTTIRGEGESRLSVSNSQYGMIQLMNNTNPGVNVQMVGRQLTYGYLSDGVHTIMTEQRHYGDEFTVGSEYASQRFYTRGGGTLREALRLGHRGTGTAFISSNFPDVPVVAVRAIASQTSNLQQWENSAGTTLVSITGAGRMNFGGANTTSSANSISGGQYLGNLYGHFLTIEINGIAHKIPYVAA